MNNNPSNPDETKEVDPISEVILKDRVIAYKIVSLTDAPMEVLRILSKHKDSTIRAMVASHKNATEEILLSFEKDISNKVKSATIKNKLTPIGVAILMADDIDTKATLAGRDDVPQEELLKLSKYKSHRVRAAVAGNKITPDEILKALCEDQEETVRKIAKTVLGVKDSGKEDIGLKLEDCKVDEETIQTILKEIQSLKFPHIEVQEADIYKVIKITLARKNYLKAYVYWDKVSITHEYELPEPIYDNCHRHVKGVYLPAEPGVIASIISKEAEEILNDISRKVISAEIQLDEFSNSIIYWSNN